jgi:Fanconi anemia group M protein
MYVSHPLLRENLIESRRYQEIIVEEAINKNTLVVVPTALGKTVIAVLLAAKFLETFKKKKVLMLAPTRPLAAQHGESFRKFLKMDESKIAVLTGHTPTSERGSVWRDSRLLCATPHVVQNDFKMGRYNSDELCLVVFDEAHRAVGEYPYVRIVSALDCRILALTASPGGDVESIEEVCKNLKIENVEIRDEKDPDVKSYVKGLEVEWRKLELPEPYRVIRNLLLALQRERLKVLKTKGVIRSASTKISKKELLSLMNELQKKISNGQKDFFLSVSSVSGTLSIAHALDLLETQGMGPLNSYLKRIDTKARTGGSSKALRGLAWDHRFKRILAMTENLKKKYVDPKQEALKQIIQETKRGIKIIVFTQYRDTAREIVKNINEIEGVRAVRFVGQMTKEGDAGLSQKEQLKILDGFIGGEFNVLVATQVAEEGLDIPSVDLVVFYEPVPSEIRAIQRRGRTGRKRAGKVVVLMTKDTRDEGIYWSSAFKERRMKKSLRQIKDSSEEKGNVRISRWIE